MNKGFSLLEIVISMLLFGMILLWTLPSVVVFNYSNRSTTSLNAIYSLSLGLSEKLYALDFDDLGADTLVNCLDANGKVVRGTTGGLCVETGLNYTGYTASESTSDTSYRFTRYSVVCDNVLNLAGGYTGDPCDIPTANLTTGPVPDDLSCNAAGYTATQKEVKIMSVYYDRHGECHEFDLRYLRFDG